MRVKYDADTKQYFEIGDPLDHTCSAFVHNAMYELINANAISLNCVVKKGELEKFCDMVRTFGFAGFDITMPHKSDIIPFLDECDQFSKLFNCVNHVKNVGGKLIGIGLDGVGMRMALEKNGVIIEGKEILILGAGSVAGPIAAELCKRSAKGVIVLNRTVQKAEHIAKTLNEYFKIKTEYGTLSEKNLINYAPKSDIVVQCTSLGMQGNNDEYDSVKFIEYLDKNAVVADVLYYPPTSKLLAKAEQCGHKVINGMGMLLYQQFASIMFHFGVELPSDAYSAAEEALMVALAMRKIREKKLLIH